MSKAPTKIAAAAAQSKAAARKPQVRQTITLELVAARAPHASLAENLARTFGIDPVDYAAVRESTEQSMVLCANALVDDLNAKALEIHLQRVVGSFVSSAYGAATFYQSKVTQARDLTTASQNDDRDEDRDGVSGFDGKAQRAREFAASMGLQAFALMAAAEGAAHAYAHITGEEWKAYEAPVPATSSVGTRSATEQMKAFG